MVDLLVGTVVVTLTTFIGCRYLLQALDGRASLVSKSSNAQGTRLLFLKPRKGFSAEGGLPALGRSGALARYVARQQERRLQLQCVKDMPEFLDVVVLGLSAGLSFDGSLELYCKKFRTPLASQVEQALMEMKIGLHPRQQALCRLARRVKSPSMDRFVEATLESLQFGTPLASSLQRQAQLIRSEFSARVSEEIQRAPVKMLIPLGTLIVPSMLLAILGPLLQGALSS